MGPQASKSHPGRQLVKPAGPRAERARQEIDHGRRDAAGHVFGALQPATGAAFAATYERRTAANWVDFLGRVEGWIGPTAERARQEVDYGRRGTAGYVFGALRPATGEALALTCERRTTANGVDFLAQVEGWISCTVRRHPFNG